MTNRWMTWLANLATHCAVVAMALWGGIALAQGNAPGGGADFSGSLQEGSASLADHWVEPGSASTQVTQSQFVDDIDYYLEEMQGPPPTFYDANIPNDYGVGYAATQDLNEVFYRVGRVNRAFNQESTSINAFIPMAVDMDQNLWFINPRATITDDSSGGASVTIGRRFYVPEEDRVYGAALSWDYDAGHVGKYNQFGGSFEAIGRYLQWRFNFSLPVGKERHAYNAVMGPAFFVDDNIGFIETRSVEQAYQQYDLEAAMPLPYLGRHGVTVGVGPYYLNGNGREDSWGVSTRAELQVTEDLWANIQVTNDDIFGSNAFLNFEFTLPNGMPRQVASQLPIRDWMTQSVRRNYRVAVDTQLETRSMLFLNPKDGAPIEVAHIDPDRLAMGTGDVLTPYMSVAEYMAVPMGTRADDDIIFVQRRADGTDTNLNTTITLLDCQRLLGEGTVHTFESTLGTFPLPGFTPGPAPLLTNSMAMVPGSPVVTLADGNEVSGFTIDATDTGTGIVGMSIDGFNINRNTFMNVVNGVVITSDTSPVTGLPLEDYGIVSMNTFTGDGFGAIDGVRITHTAGTIDLLIADNTVTGFMGEDANGDGMLAPSEDADMDGVLDPGEDTNMNGMLDLGEDADGDGLLDQGRGIVVINTGGTIDADDPTSVMTPTGIVRNTVTASGTGIQVIGATGTDTNLVIDANTITGSTNATTDMAGNFLAAGLDVRAAGAGATVDIDSVTGNVVTGGAGDGASFVSSAGGVMTFADPTMMGAPVVTANTFNTNAGHGATFESEGVASVTSIESVSGNSFNTNGQDGANFEARMGGTVTLDLFQGNTANDNTEDGVSVVSTDAGSSVTYAIGGLMPGEGNTTTGNGDDGISVSADMMGTATGSILGNMSTGNLNGLNVVATAGGMINLNDSVLGYEIMSNDFSGNTEVGLILSAFDGDVDALVHLNTITGNGSFGISLMNDTMMGPSTLNAIIGGSVPADMMNTITGNGDAGIAGQFLGMPGSTTTTTIQNNIISGNINGGNVDFDGEGIHLRAGELATLVADVLDNTIAGNAGAGAKLFANGGAMVGPGGMTGFNLDRNTITGNGAGNMGGGVNIMRDGNAMIIADLTDNMVTGNTGSGLDVMTTGGNSGTSDTMVTATTNTFSMNTFHGAIFATDGVSATFANLVCNTIDANGVNGITVVTDAGSFFGTPFVTPSVFDGNIITGHIAGAGISLNELAGSTLLVDINGDSKPSIISGNMDGIVINATGSGTTAVTVGNPANPFPDVIISENTDNGIEFNDSGSGTTSLIVDNVALSGNRLTGGPSNNGLDVNYTGSSMSTVTVRDSVITNFGADGINVLYDRNNDMFGSLTMRVEDSEVGQDMFNFNGNDGWEILVMDGGASFTSDGSTFVSNAVDGIRFRTIAETLFNGATLNVASDVDTDGNAIPDSVSATNPGLLAFADYVIPFADSGVSEFSTSLTVIGGSVASFNGRNGVRLEVGSSTTQNVSLQGSDFSGNTVSDIDISPFASGNPTAASVDNAEGMLDTVVLDPMANLNLLFGNMAPNTGNRVTQITTNPASAFTNADVFKGANRPVMGDFRVTVPDPFAPPVPNMFTNFGMPINEVLFFPMPWIVTAP